MLLIKGYKNNPYGIYRNLYIIKMISEGMEQSLFLRKEGSTPKHKVLDFLITAQDFDYSLKDIAGYAEVSYPAMKQLKKSLVQDKWILMTRKVGRAQMYKLNVQSEKVQKFMNFYWGVINEELEKTGSKKKVSTEFLSQAVQIQAGS